MTFVGAVLAGGRSTRMGRPKEAIRLPDGNTMLEHVAQALELVCDRVVVVGAPAGRVSRPTIADRVTAAGPLGGIDAMLASDLGSAYLVCPCDLPRLDAATLAFLREPGSRPVVVLHVTGEHAPRPLPLRIEASAAADVRRALDDGMRALRQLIDLIGYESRPLDDPAPLHNANEPADLTPPPA